MICGTTHGTEDQDVVSKMCSFSLPPSILIGILDT